MQAKISILSSPVVFGCQCTIESNYIRVGILALSDEFEPGEHVLYDGDQAYPVHIPNFKSQVVYEAILPRLNDAAV